jgi:hypothetical protein
VPVEGRHAAAEAASPSVTSKTPEEICAKNSVWTRSMCHFQLCQKREFATLPFCIDAVKKWEKREIPDVGN